MIGNLYQLIGLSLRDPDAALATLRRMRIGTRESWFAIMLTAAVNAIVSHVVTRGLPTPEAALATVRLATIASQPMLMALAQLISAALFAVAIVVVGRLFGGRGSFTTALLATAWIEVAMVAVQILQLFATIAVPPLGPLLSLLTFALFFVLAVQMIRAVHGFRNPLLVALGMLGTMLAAGFVLNMIALSFGIVPGIYL